jgi:hypothetical protein
MQRKHERIRQKSKEKKTFQNYSVQKTAKLFMLTRAAGWPV